MPTDAPTQVLTKQAQPTSASAPEPTPTASGLLLYTSTETSENDLYTMDQEGRNRKRLTRIGRIRAARFSPDGKRVVFERAERTWPDYSSDLYLINLDGSGLTNITNTPDYVESNPSWSPDGARIIFEGRNTVANENEIYIMDSDGSDRALFIDIDPKNQYPAWSPIGDRVAFVGMEAKDASGFLRLINPDGSNLTSMRAIGVRPIWSPDGHEIIYANRALARFSETFYQIRRITVWGSDDRCIVGCAGVFNEFDNYPAAWRGSQIAFRGWENGHWNVFIANDDGSGIVKLTTQEVDERVWDWQP
jgi:Tol biopolymer transport system component